MRRNYIHTFIYERLFLACQTFQSSNFTWIYTQLKSQNAHKSHIKLHIMIKIQSITNVLSIHESITSLTHQINHSYFQTWNVLLAAAILKMHLYFDIATDPTSIWINTFHMLYILATHIVTIFKSIKLNRRGKLPYQRWIIYIPHLTLGQSHLFTSINSHSAGDSLLLRPHQNAANSGRDKWTLRQL